MSCDPDWDDEVDVVCTDSGVAGLATAICAVDEDGEVYLAEPRSGRPSPPRNQRRDWFALCGDTATDEYLAELTADIDLAALTQCDADVPVRLAGDVVPPRRRPVPDFEGWRLREWAARCIPSPTGYLYTQVTDWTSATVDFGDDELLTVTEVGETTIDPARPNGSVRDWLVAEALAREMIPHPVASFDGLVFEEGEVRGAKFSTEYGSRMIRARHGVLICRNRTDADDVFDRPLPGDPPLRVALVGKQASRFGRVELLTSDAEVAAMAQPSRGSSVTPLRS
ncbi:hypothetical protein PDG61_30780 [Mycolicibacterium sp. BiH015]|uniref:hypothetical protein n=1 Tax=Mycolicibacterium sp. BiH015 TaxID=3018808 RepID=UPI0022E7FAAC|nr:hypothetical protein [Mycolicibacterium sp. BiH015]MDA2895331.1 hypothetical protein [Mycolicibacterium sp. BiH015]